MKEIRLSTVKFALRASQILVHWLPAKEAHSINTKKNSKRRSVFVIIAALCIGILSWIQPEENVQAAQVGKNTVKIFIGSPTYARHHMTIDVGKTSDEFRYEVKGYTVKSSSYTSSNPSCLKIINTAQGKCKVQAIKEGAAYVVLTLATKEGQTLTERVFISICTRYTDCTGSINQNASVYKGASTNADVENEDNKGTLSKNAKVTVLSTCQNFYVIRRTDGGAFNDGMDSGFVQKNGISIPVTGVSLHTEMLEMEVGAKVQLKATVAPVLADNKQVAWQSADEAVAAVTQDGTVIAGKAGCTQITVRTADGGKCAVCQITVKLRQSSTQWEQAAPQPVPVSPAPTKEPDIRVKALDYKRIQITWSKKAGAKKYQVRRSTKKNGKYKTIATVSKKKIKYVDKTPKYRKKYYYQVRGVKKNKKYAYTQKAWGRTARKNIKKTNRNYFKKYYSQVCQNAKQDMNAYYKAVHYIDKGDVPDYIPVKYKMTGKELEIHVYLDFVKYTEKKDSKGKKEYKRESVWNKQEKMTYLNNSGKEVSSKASYIQLFLDGIKTGYHNIKIEGDSKDFPYLEFKTKLVTHVKGRDKGMHKNQRYIEVLIGGECPNCESGEKGNHWYHAGPNENASKQIVYEGTHIIYMPTNPQVRTNKKEVYSYEKIEVEYKSTAAHELGHIFGLADAYYDENKGGDRCDENEETCVKYKKGMYDNLMKGHITVYKILSNDLEMMLQAYQKECRAPWTFMEYYKKYKYDSILHPRSVWIKTDKDKQKQ